MQIEAGLKKELLHITRTKRLLGLILVYVGFAIFTPLMIKGMIGFAQMYDELIDMMSQEFGMQINMEMESLMKAAYGVSGPTVTAGMVNSISNAGSMNIIILAFLLMATAGGEQKKRSVIIPSCAGLSVGGYIIPKFLLYPLLSFVLAFVGNIASYFISIMVFDVNDVGFAAVAVSGIFLGLYTAFHVILQLFIGISSGKPGLATTIVILVNSFFPSMLSGMGLLNYFNPFALLQMSAACIYNDADALPMLDGFTSTNIVASIAITLILCLIFFFITMFAQTAKRVENSGDDVIL